MKTLTYISRAMLTRLGLVVVMVVWIVGMAWGQTVVTNPTSPWTVPTGVTSIKVEVWGGGGAGGGCNNSGFFGTTYGSAGGGGAYNLTTFTVSPGQTYTITIGAGGTGGSDAAGNPGNASSVSGTGGSVSANPGLGGPRRGGTPGGAGGTGGFNNGGTGGVATSNGAGGGGGAGNATPTGIGNGGAGSNAAAGTAGSGTLPGGAGGAPQTGSGNGNVGIAPSGGGGGGRATGLFDGAKSGGNGAAGKVVITYIVAPTSVSVDRNNFCADDAGNIILSYSGGSGTILKWYAGGCGTGTSIGSGQNLSIASPATTTTYYARWESDPLVPTACASVTVTVRNLPTFNASTGQDVSCYGGSDGTIILAIIGGVDNSPYTFSINNGSDNYTNSFTGFYPTYTITGVPSGTHKVRIKDKYGCESLFCAL